MNKTLIQLYKLLIVAVVVICSPLVAQAQDDLACAAVYPCFENGEIMPEFNSEGYCGDRYRLLCSKVKASQVADELVSCQKENAKYKDSEIKLSKKIRSLRKKLSSSN